MNTTDAKIFHDIAMNLSFEAKMAKSKGDDSAYQKFISQAAILEKEAALKMHNEPKDKFWRYVLVRSAAWLAFKSGNFRDALNLVKFGKKGTPPDFIIQELSDLENNILQKINDSNNQISEKESSNIFGFLVSANIPKSQIEIQKQDNSLITVEVPEEKIHDIVRMHWGQAVEIQGIKNRNGKIDMQNINRAA